MDDNIQGAGNSIPPHCGTASICHSKGQEIHQDDRIFSMYLSEEPGQGWLGKACEVSQIHHRYPASVTYTKGQQPYFHKMLGWCVLCLSPRLQGAHWILIFTFHKFPVNPFISGIYFQDFGAETRKPHKRKEKFYVVFLGMYIYSNAYKPTLVNFLLFPHTFPSDWCYHSLDS